MNESKKYYRSINGALAHNMGRKYPNGLFYRRACIYMGIDPDNNPNYKEGIKK